MPDVGVMEPLALVQPGPYAIAITVPGNGAKQVVLRIETPSGSHMTIISVEDAEAIGEQFTNIARQMKSGIVLPPSTEVSEKIVKEALKQDQHG